ncbi:ankyrin repeat domain-containing protein [Rhodovulum sulfidophilum]|uniref:Ankyrin repeat domain-containing protein n=1 Tax=Rhodovulum sulfidophilum TaxID=35806 RepID=A0ABS1RYA2_RHOSU|nr:ankyrin repeat domain-containing protein [Rhodovulum sulfidophilum]MBL3610628.1 ankyrin repeat domain-containing protein [Rhodovulum sulfidophilum]MCE8456275.1 ankyrin repeat domain-containing protein [Rhodovulum sulfidophilum]
MVYDLTPIPQPCEIVAFLIRAMSHIDDANEAALKKALQRLRQGKPLSPDASNDLLTNHLRDFYDANGNQDWGATDFLPMLQGYTQLCLQLDCAALPSEIVREVFDRVAFGCFQDLFRNTLPSTGVSAREVLGNPEKATQILWQSRVKDFGLTRLAGEIESRPGLHRGGENWVASISRWSKGDNNVQINTILALMKHWDRRFARALMVGRLYQRYCNLSLVDCRKHIPGYEIPLTLDAIQSAIASTMEAPAIRESCDLSEAQLKSVNDIVRLTDPRRKKAKGDISTIDALFEGLEKSLNGQPRLSGLAFYRGIYLAQLGRLADALDAFDRAANWFKFRSAVQMKCCLHYVLNISRMLGRRRLYAKWEGFCVGLGLDVDIPDAKLAMARDFPELFPEATSILKSHPIENYLIDLPCWENRPVDLRAPNRIIKGYGPTATPQLALFAHLGQVDKVKQLLDAGADPNMLDKNAGSALLNALQGGDDACFWALLPVTSLEVINRRTNGGKSALLVAVSLGKVDLVKGLLAQGADTEVRGARHQTALFEAIGQFADPNAPVQTAIQARLANANLPAFLRRTTSPFSAEEGLAQSVSSHSPGELEILLELGKYLLKGDSPPTREILRFLLESGADVNAVVGEEQLTPFLYAAEIGNP